MAAKREQVVAWIAARPRLAGADLGARMRSTAFALLGLTTAACLVVVALLVHQGVSLLPSLPLPGLGSGNESVGVAKPVGDSPSPIVAARDRLATATPAALADGAAAGQAGSRGGRDLPKAAPPGPASVVAPGESNGPVASPVPVPSAPDSDGAPAPAPTPAPTTTTAPSVPDAQPATTATDAQPGTGSSNKGRSSRGSSGSRGSTSIKAQVGTDAAAPVTKAPTQAPVTTPVAPPMTDAEPDPATDADPNPGH